MRESIFAIHTGEGRYPWQKWVPTFVRMVKAGISISTDRNFAFIGSGGLALFGRSFFGLDLLACGPQARPHRTLVARRAPSAKASNFAQQIEG